MLVVFLNLDDKGEDENNGMNAKWLKLGANVEGLQEGGRGEDGEVSDSASLTTATLSVTLQTESDPTQRVLTDEEKGDLQLHSFNNYICQIFDNFQIKRRSIK